MDLFGKKKLRRKIEELEEKIEELEKYKKRWEKEKERYKQVVTEKQEAEKKLNKMENRVSTLRDRLEEDRKKEEEQMKKEKLGLSRAYRYLDSLSSIELGRDVFTAYRNPGNSFLNDKMTEVFLHEPLMIKSVFQTPLKLDEKEYNAKNFVTNHLKEALDRRTLFIHFSAGGSGIGIFEDREPVQTSVIKSDIKSQHKKGGYSQKRFERLREQQIRSHIEDVEEELERYLEKSFEQVVVTGTEERNEIHGKVEEDAVKVKTRKGNIAEKEDLVDSFESGMGVFHVRLDDETAEDILSNIG